MKAGPGLGCGASWDCSGERSWEELRYLFYELKSSFSHVQLKAVVPQVSMGFDGL